MDSAPGREHIISARKNSNTKESKLFKIKLSREFFEVVPLLKMGGSTPGVVA